MAPPPMSDPDASLPEQLVRLQRVADGADALLAYVDAEERYRFVNAAYRTWFGREPEAMLGRTVAELVGPAAYARVAPHVRAALQGHPVRYAQRLPFAGGVERAVEVLYTPHLLADGRVAGFVVYSRDVSAVLAADAERLRALEAARDKELLLEAVLQQLPTGVIIRDRDGRLALSNSRAAALLRSEPAGDMGRVAVDFLDLEGRPLPRERWAMTRALKGEPSGDVLAMLAVPGAPPRALRTAGTPVFDGAGKQAAAVLTIEDVTDERRAAELQGTLLGALQDLAGSGADLSHALESLAGRVARFLASACVLALRLRGEEALDVAAVSHPEAAAREALRAMAHAEYRELRGTPLHVLRSGRAVRVNDVPQEGLLERLSPMTRPFVEREGLRHMLIVPLRAQGEVIGTLGVSRGRDGAPYTDEDQDFLQALADRAGLLVHNARLLEQTREAVRLRDEFLSVAGHELRTPLTSLRLQLQLLQRALPAQGEERAAGRLDTALKQVDRLTELVGGLLDVSRIETGRLELQLAEVDLGQLVHEAVERTGELFRVAGCPVSLRAEAVTGAWDAQRLDQVVVNLLSNAAKYGAGHPVEVAVEAEGAGWARLTVRDAGIGIAPEDLARLFRRFERAVSGRHYGGLGLGLYITRQLVEAMGGTIDVQSVPERGSTFTVRLPREAPVSPQGRGKG